MEKRKSSGVEKEKNGWKILSVEKREEKIFKKNIIIGRNRVKIGKNRAGGYVDKTKLFTMACGKIHSRWKKLQGMWIKGVAVIHMCKPLKNKVFFVMMCRSLG